MNRKTVFDHWSVSLFVFLVTAVLANAFKLTFVQTKLDPLDKANQLCCSASYEKGLFIPVKNQTIINQK